VDTTIPLEVLLVEDNSGEIRLTQKAFHAIIPSLHFNVAVDGRKAMSFLNREGVHADAPRPDLTLLDLNLPRMDGREVLARIKKDDSLKTLPVVILTTSDADTDIAKAINCTRMLMFASPCS